MAIRPRIPISDGPTKGIDVRTKAEIYRITRTLASEGVGIVSSEMEELTACATRIVAMPAGRVVEPFDASEAPRERIVAAIFRKEAAHA